MPAFTFQLALNCTVWSLDLLQSNISVNCCHDGSRAEKAKYNTLSDNWLNILGLIKSLKNTLNDNGTKETVR